MAPFSVRGERRQPAADDARPEQRQVAGEQRGGVGATGAADPVRGEPRPGVEVAYSFSPAPTLAHMRSNNDVFQSTFMKRIVRTWPQAPVTALSKKARAEGLTCSGSTPGAEKGTSVEMKT